MGNTFASLALLLWLPLGIVLGLSLPRRKAALIIFFGGAMLLPQGLNFDAPGVPALSKYAISSLTAWLACWVFARSPGEDRSVPPATRLFLIMVMASSVLTALTNKDPIAYGVVYIPGLALYDGLSHAFSTTLLYVVPFFLGQVLFGTPRLLRELLTGLVMAMLLYVPLVLFEVRFSPMLHTKLYGYFQHDFIQMMRSGGFRAIVFLSHALAVAFLLSQALLATIGLAKAADPETRWPIPPLWTAIILGVSLFLCKSLASMMYALVAVPVLLWTPTRQQARFAKILTLVVLAFPLLRSADWVPTEWLLEKARGLNEDRARSLDYRFINEDMLLVRARERIVFGWGQFGRNLLFDPFDGKPLAVTDGEWIIRLGEGGIFHFVTIFSALMLPVIRTGSALSRAIPTEGPILAATAIMLALTGVDLIPNSLSHAIPFLLAGALTSACSRVGTPEGARSR